MLHDSIAHALSHRAEAVEYAQQFGRGLDRNDTDKFVGMYVNQLTLDYGTRGRAALERFFSEAFEKGLIPGASAGPFRPVTSANTNPSRSTTMPGSTSMR